MAESQRGKDRKFLDKVMKRLKKAFKAYGNNLHEAIEDLRFLNGDQWDEDEKKRRKSRKQPMLTINMLPEKVDRVVGDIRQNRARIKIRTADINADPNIAAIREGIIRGIEYDSNAAAIYDYTGGRVAECGHGAWRYLTRWCEDNPFVQEIYMSLIKNSFTVLLDPAAKEPNKSDAKWGFILSKMSREEFEDTYPKANVPSESFNEVGEGLDKERWWDGETLTIAEYFEIQEEDKVKCLMADGSVIDEEEANKRVEEWKSKKDKIELFYKSANTLTPQMQQQQPQPIPIPTSNTPGNQDMSISKGGVHPPVQAATPVFRTPPPPTPNSQQQQQPQGGVIIDLPPEPKILRHKNTKATKVVQYVVTAVDIISGPNPVPGKYIPIVEVTGKERDIEGETIVRGIVRDAKDPQRLVNYWNTAGSETVALAPKVPWVGTAKQFEGYEEDYANANIDSLPFLKYNPDPKAPGPPQRLGAGEPPMAIFSQISIAEKNLDRVTGGFELREAAPDASSKALIQRQKPTELSTFTYIDNLAQAICYGGKIINEMIPEVYDTERDVSVRNEDETETFVPINTTAENAARLIEKYPHRYIGMNASMIRKAILGNGIDNKFNSIGIGKYKVIVDLGPSYATQRQEAADNFVKLVQTAPELWKIAGDLIVENLDVAGSQKLANRIRKTMNPKFLELKPGEAPPPPPPTPPALQLLMEKGQTEKIKQNKELLKTRVEMIKLYKETKETDVELRNEILKTIKELYAPEHYADSVLEHPVNMDSR